MKRDLKNNLLSLGLTTSIISGYLFKELLMKNIKGNSIILFLFLCVLSIILLVAYMYNNQKIKRGQKFFGIFFIFTQVFYICIWFFLIK